MADTLRLMCVLAHPDDESLGVGGTLAKYAAEGIETYLVTATRGERGWFGAETENPGPEALGRIREAELLAAANVLGIRQVDFLDYIDGDLDQADPAEIVATIVGHLRRVKPQVVITFGPHGSYGHPDHIAISQFTTVATICAADADYRGGDDLPPHRVSKLYYLVETKELMRDYQSVFGDLKMCVDGVERRAVAWEDWSITTWIDSIGYWRIVLEAVACHRSQLPAYAMLDELPEERHKQLWGLGMYYRVYSTVNGGRKIEYDLFEGLC